MSPPPEIADDDELARIIPPVDLPPGTVIFASGSPLRGALLVRSGQVRVELAHPELARPLVLRLCGPGRIVAPAGLSPEAAHDCQAVADTRVQAFLLTPEALQKLEQAAPAKALAVTRLLLAQATAELVVSQRGHLEDRLLAEPDREDEQILAAARAAQQEIETWDDGRINGLLTAIGQTITDRAEALCRRECEQTGTGRQKDKLHKLRLVTELALGQLLEVNPIGKLGPGEPGVAEYGAPVGVVFAVTPATDLVPNCLFTVLTALKTRNAIVFGYPLPLVALGDEVVQLVREALRAHGAPPDLVQHLGRRSGRLRISRFMRNPAVDLILASGGAGLINAAHSSGNPVQGSPAGNVPVLIAADADLDRAARLILASKSYDHGVMSWAESNLVVDRRVHAALVTSLHREGALVLSEAETERACQSWFDPGTRRIQRSLVGQPARRLIEVAGLDAPPDVRVIIMTARDRHLDVVAGEKLAPLLAMFVEDSETVLARCRQLMEPGSKGQTAVIHSEDADLIERFTRAMPAARVLVNTPAAFGTLGVSTNLPASFLPGGGLPGKTITSDNIGWRHLINVKRIVHHAWDIAPELPGSTGGPWRRPVGLPEA